jgi:peptide-methionine (R)-S-oxide reductase
MVLARPILYALLLVPLSWAFISTSSARHFSPLQLAITDQEWRDRLTPDQYYVLREQGTERPNSSSLNDIKEDGTFVCAGCGSPLFVTATKYESGTGWPSFYSPVDQEAVKLSTDFKLIVPRTEVSCATCSGHLGHVFDDGPQPTGQRFCMNGVAMKFQSDIDHPELASQIQERRRNSPYRLSALQVLPGIFINGVMGSLFFQSFVARMELTGFTSPLDIFPLIPAVYFGVQAVQACARLKLT